MKYKVILVLIFVIGFSDYLKSQPGWNWPADEETAKEKNVLYSDLLREKKYKEAADAIDWLLENAPDLNASIYINGVKIYTGLVNETTDATQKRAYQDKVMGLYDKRIQYFNNEAKVLNRKAYDAYKYYKNDKAKYQELFDMYEKTFELNGNNVATNNLVAYMDVIRRYKLSGGQLTDEDVLDRYDNIMTIIDAKMKTADAKSKPSLIKNQEFVDKLLTTIVQVDCEFVENKLGVKLKETPDNVKLAKKIMGLALANKCTESQTFLDASMAVFEQEPTFGIAKVIALKSDAAGDYQNADKYYTKAIELAGDNTQKGEILYAYAASLAKRGSKSKSRKYALDAASADPSLKVAYKLVGDLYLTSYNECKGGVSKVADRGVYLAAFEMYQRAGDSRMMNTAKEQFPSIEDIFELDMQEGQQVAVGCWINQKVTIQRRPS